MEQINSQYIIVQITLQKSKQYIEKILFLV